MSEPGVVRRVLLPLVVVVLTTAGLLNTYGDSTDVERLAMQTACGGTPCPAQMTEFQRSPFSHEYAYQLEKGGHVAVKCARTAIFFGEYHCEKQ